VKAEFIRAKARAENPKGFRMGVSLRHQGRLQDLPASDVLDRRWGGSWFGSDSHADIRFEKARSIHS
jgi:hypothetical protein